ncbi:tetratricopeptide repeat protein [Algibacter sp. PT7-4]|uniref:tetratricopeptide repeat protein n=1 Tax=Algibacter ulvanivorans TaxID=3400999 RepID=UPI003AAA5F4A
MKQIAVLILTLTSLFSFSQNENKELLLAAKKANNFVYQGNQLIEGEDYVLAEMAYRKAISKQSTTKAAAYNLGTSYYKNGKLEESLYRLEQATKTATSKSEKHKAFHNIGNILMENKKCKEAVEAYKNALRNNPSDDETRYNLSVAKICAEQQKQDDQNKDDKEDKQDNKDKQNQDKENQDNKENKENKENQDQDNKDKEGEDKEDKKDDGDQEKKEGDDEKDEDGKPKDEEKDKGKGEQDKKKEQQKPQPKPGQLSPQQIKNLLEAMNNQEQKVQEKMNAEKQKGVKIKTEKDW